MNIKNCNFCDKPIAFEYNLKFKPFLVKCAFCNLIMKFDFLKNNFKDLNPAKDLFDELPINIRKESKWVDYSYFVINLRNIIILVIGD